MKPLFTLLIALGFAFSANAQNVLTYEFVSNMSEKDGAGPTMAILGNEGVFVEDTLEEIGSEKKFVYRFEANSGFQFDNVAAGGFIGEDYTIELYFVFDELTSWKRVVDWKNRTTDYGAYVYYGELNFYPYLYSEEAPVLPGEYTYYVITRDGESDQLIIYTDANVYIDFIDDGGDALVGQDGVINFFHDDLVVPNEASSGAVAMLRMYNYKLDSSEVKENFENLGSQVFGIHTQPSAGEIRIYPNPARDQLTVEAGDLEGEYTLKVVTLTGEVVFQKVAYLQSGNRIPLNTSSLPNGLYLLHLNSDKTNLCEKFSVYHK
jgi:hypothetical protein